MIFVNNTPNNVGVAIHGDYLDFEALYKSFLDIVGDEGEYRSYDAARMRVLGVCYDLRHAMQGDREAVFVDNGLSASHRQKMAVLAPDKNLYLCIRALWPETLFVMMALNDFIKLHVSKGSKTNYEVMWDKNIAWDETIAQVRHFQSIIAKCLKETVPEDSYSRMLNVMHKSHTWYDHFPRQYLDILNARFLGMSPDKRLKSISPIVKQMADRHGEYREVMDSFNEAGRRLNAPPDDIDPVLNWPDEIIW